MHVACCSTSKTKLKQCATTWPFIHRLMKMAPPWLLLMPPLLLPPVVVEVQRQTQFRTVSAGPTARCGG